MAGHAEAVLFDAATASLVALGPDEADNAVVTVMPAKGLGRAVPLPTAATAMTGDNDGHVYVSTRGGTSVSISRRAGPTGYRSTARTAPNSPRSPVAPTASWSSAAPTVRFTR